jgi:hypothetical protein
MVKTDAEGAPTGQELPAELILAYLTYRALGEPNASRGGALRTHLCGPPGVLRRALLSLCRRRQRPRALLLRTDAEVLRTAASPTPASPTGKHPADVGPLLVAADQLQARDKSRMP